MLKCFTQEQAEQLVKLIKKALVNIIYFPERGKSKEFELISEYNGQSFKVIIRHSGLRPGKYEIMGGLIYEGDWVWLLELHMGATNRHKNQDESVIQGSHWHVYSELHGRREAFSAEDFRNDEFVDNTITFLKGFNVAPMPEIYYQSADL